MPRYACNQLWEGNALVVDTLSIASRKSTVWLVKTITTSTPVHGPPKDGANDHLSRSGLIQGLSWAPSLPPLGGAGPVTLMAFGIGLP